LNFLDRAAQTLPGVPNFVLLLQVHPEFLGGTEKTRQANGGVRQRVAEALDREGSLALTVKDGKSSSATRYGR
jgi:hypothetical protein